MITIGCDPELFCINTKTGQPVSVHSFMKGSKSQPVEVPYGAVQVDGTAAEFNIHPAAKRSVFIRNIKHVRRLLDSMVSAHNASYELKAVPTVFFNREYFAGLPEGAKALGCEPDFDAYKEAVNPKPDSETLMRTGSGHVHIGWQDPIEDPFEEKHIRSCIELTKELDTTLYQFSKVWDKDVERMKLYGKPGAFRPKPYGLEYRVLSNAWLNHEWSMAYVFEAAKVTAERFFNGFSIKEKIDKLQPFNIIRGTNILEANGFPSLREFAPGEI